MTGYPPEAQAKILLSQGIVAWLQKPLSINQLARAIDEALRG